MQEKFVFDNLPFALDFETVRSRLRLQEEEDIALMEPMFQTAVSLARPKAVLRPCAVESIDGDIVTIGGQVFRSRVLAGNLAGVSTVYAYVATCGTEVDDWSHQEPDPIVALWLDMIKELILGEARGHFLDAVRGATDLTNLSSMSPGSGDVDVWPIAQQRPLFDLIGDVTGDTGVRLTESFLMLPTKSVSGILFPADKDFITCTLCSRLHCTGRRAPYQGDM